MLRGCQKKIIVLKNTGSEMFEEAYFIIKPEFEDKSDFNIIEEATKIISSNQLVVKKPRVKKEIPLLLPFGIGALLGALLSILLYLTI